MVFLLMDICYKGRNIGIMKIYVFWGVIGMVCKLEVKEIKIICCIVIGLYFVDVMIELGRGRDFVIVVLVIVFFFEVWVVL